MYGLSDEDRRLRDAARAFADELIPHEVAVELAGGVVPPGLAREFRDQALARGLYATNMPIDVGGPGCTMLQQVLVQEQAGRVTNGLGWVMHTPPSWWVERRDRVPARALAAAGRARRAARVLRHHRGVRRVRRRRDQRHGSPQGRRLRRQRGEVARDVVQRRRLLLRAGQARRWRTRPARARSAVRRGGGGAHARSTRTTSPTTTRSCRSPTSGCRSSTWSVRRAPG